MHQKQLREATRSRGLQQALSTRNPANAVWCLRVQFQCQYIVIGVFYETSYGQKKYLKPAIQPFDPVAQQIVTTHTKVVGTEQAIDMPREMFSGSF